MSDLPKTPGRHYNRLIREKSPYLLQHAENPVDWFPWGEEAFRKAREGDRPIFLSIGYATCHWCHVMAHESFEDEDVSRLLNDSFVSIKLDREERPDIDQVYMSVCQVLTGQGGWPLTIFMTPDKVPFFAGTYFPQKGRPGLIGFADLLSRIANLWRTNREALLKSGRQVLHLLQPEAPPAGPEPVLDEEVLEKAFDHFARVFDEENGGFGKAPKFPTPHHLTFLLRWQHRSRDAEAARIVEKTLDAMRRGGIFDQIGYGFHRYSVDEFWLVPHFEKMLYDQALLAIAYIEAYQALGKPKFARTAEEIFSYVLRDMTSPEGAFYSAEDADSEGEEGLFYIWTPGEVKKALGAEPGEIFCRAYGITPEGNFENGRSIAYGAVTLDRLAAETGRNARELADSLEKARELLFATRARRVHPLKDDKVLTAWNGLMISALALGGAVLSEPAYARAAREAAEFVITRLYNSATGLLLRRYRAGEAAINGFLEDYSFFVRALLDLYETGFDRAHFELALGLTEKMRELFEDSAGGGFFGTAAGDNTLVMRIKEDYDGAEPSGNSVAILNLLRLARMTGRADLRDSAEHAVRAFASRLVDAPGGLPQMLAACEFLLAPPREIVIVGERSAPDTEALLGILAARFVPNKVVLLVEGEDTRRALSAYLPSIRDMGKLNGKASAYVCENYSCRLPVSEPAQLAELLK